MTTLQQQCEEIRKHVGLGWPNTYYFVHGQAKQDIKTLLAYIDELRRPSDATDIQRIVTLAEQYGENTIYSLDDIKTLLHALAESQRECAAYANAHAVLVAERTALQDKLFRLQSQALVL